MAAPLSGSTKLIFVNTHSQRSNAALQQAPVNREKSLDALIEQLKTLDLSDAQHAVPQEKNQTQELIISCQKRIKEKTVEMVSAGVNFEKTLFLLRKSFLIKVREVTPSVDNVSASIRLKQTIRSKSSRRNKAQPTNKNSIQNNTENQHTKELIHQINKLKFAISNFDWIAAIQEALNNEVLVDPGLNELALLTNKQKPTYNSIIGNYFMLQQAISFINKGNRIVLQLHSKLFFDEKYIGNDTITELLDCSSNNQELVLYILLCGCMAKHSQLDCNNSESTEGEAGEDNEETQPSKEYLDELEREKDGFFNFYNTISSEYFSRQFEEIKNKVTIIVSEINQLKNQSISYHNQNEFSKQRNELLSFVNGYGEFSEDFNKMIDEKVNLNKSQTRTISINSTASKTLDLFDLISSKEFNEKINDLQKFVNASKGYLNKVKSLDADPIAHDPVMSNVKDQLSWALDNAKICENFLGECKKLTTLGLQISSLRILIQNNQSSLQKAQDIDSLKSNFTKECFLGKYNLSGFYANTKYFQRFLDLHVFINDNDLEGRALDETGIASAYYGGFALAKAFNDINAKMREIENTNGLFNARVIIEHQEELGRSHVRKQGGLKEGELPTYILPCYRSVVDLQRESVNQPWTITHCYPTPITCTLHDRLLITGKITSNNSYNLYYVN